MSDTRLSFTLIARIPADGVAAFCAYEDGVLPLLARHGGLLERRLRTADGRVEIHVVSFPEAAAFEAYRADPDRTALAPLLAQSGAEIELYQTSDADSITGEQR